MTDRPDPVDIPLPSEVLARLSRISVATLATQLFKRGLPDQFVVGAKPVSATARGFVGEAATMRFIPARPDLDTLASLPGRANLQWSAVENLRPGQVLVIDSRGDISAASAGDMLLTRAKIRGAAAVVTDGAFRDGDVIAGLDFPAYAQAITATTRLASFHVADLGVPVGLGSVAVFPGDVLVGDGDGVIVIPRELAEDVSTDGLEQEELEQWLHGRVHDGESLWGVYPPSDETRAEYEQWKGAQR